jgi:hypothetical protein
MLALVVVMTMLPVLAIAAGMALFMRRGNNAAVLSEDGSLSVPLNAAFGSLRGVGPFAGTRNNFNPVLVFHDDRVEYRVIRRTTAPYAEIAGRHIAGAPRSQPHPDFHGHRLRLHRKDHRQAGARGGPPLPARQRLPAFRCRP